MEPSRARTTGGIVYGPHARRSPTTGPDNRSGPERSPAPAAALRVNFVALVRGWMRLLAPDAWVGVHDTPHPVAIKVLRWAPIIAPAVLGSLLLTLALALVARNGVPAYAPLPYSAVVPALLAVYLLGSALLGLALYFAPNGVVWCLAFFAGPPLLLTIMLSLAFGAPGGLLVFALLAALLLIYSCWRRSLTRLGSVEVTLLLGEWYRTLPPGYNILLPGERIIATLRTTPRAFTTATQRVVLAPNRVAQARATVTYVVNAGAAWRTAGVRATWEDELRQRISASVRESLDEWRGAANGGDAATRGSIARRALDETRDWARSVGVRILSVRTHDIAVGAPDALQSPQPADGRERPTPRVERAPATPRVLPAASADGRADAPWEESLRAQTPPPISAPAALAQPAHLAAERPSLEALEDLYEAVRNRQITDTQVIREIADHFATVAHEPYAPGGALPFDPAAAARLLGDYADALDTARPAQRPAPRARVRRR
jgi:hypothetical protein